MKKITLLLLVLLLAAGTSYATDKRVQALGNNPYMLLGDDASIRLFPQRINDMNLVYFRDIHLGSPYYLLVSGDPGKTWGFYGGSTQLDDYFNVYRSIGKSSAIRLGVRLGMSSQTQNDDDKETPATTSEEKLSQANIMIDLEFGSDLGDTEFSTSVTFGKTPTLIGTLGQVGTYNGEFDVTGTKSSAEGSSARTSFSLQAKARAKKGLFFFDNSYAVFGVTYQGSSTNYSTTAGATTTTFEDVADSYLSINSTYRLFNNLNLSDDKVFLVYGLGSSIFFSSLTDEDNTTKTIDTDMNFMIMAPHFNLGLETKLKYATLRFGVDRMITTLGFTSSLNETVSGVVNDEDTYSTFTMASNGIYNYNAGMGFNYGNLQIDILVNNNFWITGPQMIFNDLYGTLGLSADLIYRF